MSIFYRSLRIGLNGKPFYLYKIRTMVENADKLGGPSTSGDDPRLTKLGKILRKFKIDELPNLWNVIKRDMNLVGSRPEVPEVMELMRRDFPEDYGIIISVRPGITDLATLADLHEEEVLRGELDPHKAYLEKIWPEKRRLQVEYIKNRSFKLDLIILTKTILKIILKD